ncbi:hypothetical protein KQ939_09155 [Planococcus sp. CP5-4]|uniref:hypothetical protein n=1 Tax=unclassified Planococcus (in: firmicutes) TaxID=2662419 RepID=UPI001C245925|nr:MULTISPECIES: hypothetical protein [unclassified Planococcus (in: firmicutes)]MBU9674734.1 hypothetical protein [Planococcus sp. CP5-4_YE]MBV0910345.1 hypothetical protein [Planococcus sp. CP5-4_UN]MBW6063879.1 hypothetical protein [Planococcus sp. CP5-4]
MLTKLVAAFNLAMSLGAFFMGISMLPVMGVFVEFPPEWVGVMPFTSWSALAMYGMIVFGIGNAVTAVYGFIRKPRTFFVANLCLGVLLLLSAALPIVLLGEWYLPLVFFFALSFIQLALGLYGVFSKRKPGSRHRTEIINS